MHHANEARFEKWNLGRRGLSFLGSLRSRRLEVVGTSGHKKRRAREKETRESPSRAPVLSFARYFQAPATQASF